MAIVATEKPSSGVTPTEKASVDAYFAAHNIPRVLESLVAQLAFHRPDEPVQFMQRHLEEITQHHSAASIPVVPAELAARTARSKSIASRHVDLNGDAPPAAAATPASVAKPASAATATTTNTAVVENKVSGAKSKPVTPAAPVPDDNMAAALPPATVKDVSQAVPAVLEERVKPSTAPRTEEVSAVTTETSVNAIVDPISASQPAEPATAEPPAAVEQSAITHAAQTATEPSSPPLLSKAVFVLGGPGSGKGTQCAKLIAEFGYKHISVGDLLREEVARKSDIGLEMDALMKEGKLVPTATVLKILQQTLTQLLAAGTGVLIDGYPRELSQALEFERTVGIVPKVLYYDCSEAEMKVRLLKRGETSGRSDDNEESIGKRLRTFVEQTVPVADYFEQSGRLIRIRSDTGTADDVYAQTRPHFVVPAESGVGQEAPAA